jgi:hypothetical protein
MNHPNSKKITIYRRSSYAMDAQKGSAVEFVAMSKKSIGSYWAKNQGKAMGSGLTFEEQKLLMPSVVDCEPEDRQFRQRLTEYFASMKTNVDYEKGLTLEIGLEKDNSARVSADNMPLELFDYITYKHALGHPQVASSKADAEGDQLIEFYIFDPQAVEDAKVLADVDNDKALTYYLAMKEEPKKIDMLLTLLGVDPREAEFAGKNAISLKLARLKKISIDRSSDFVSAYDKKHFEELYIVESLINTGIWRRSAKKVIDPDAGTTFHTSEEAVAWIKDPNNSQSLALLKGRMQESLVKTLPKKQQRNPAMR